MGKYCAYLDLSEEEQLKRMHDLALDTDVFASSYRGSVSQRFHLTPEELAARSRKGIIVLSVNTYGHAGPWQERGGFDPNGQAASGFAAAEGAGPSSPDISPVSYLADLMSGYFSAAGMMAALLRRATEGGSYHLKVSLTRTSMWVQELGMLGAEEIEGLPHKDTHPYQTAVADTAFGSVRTLANPIRFSTLRLPHNQRLVPYGADPAQWSAIEWKNNQTTGAIR
jgi:crotonobetainyl-CoA:carnitine CoA-transferase CaiB-like acyl-CoA transferase